LEIESVKILYSSLTGTAKTFANEVEEKLKNTKFVKIQKLETMDITDYDNDNLLNETSVCIFILATYNVEGPLDW
jgi:tRNA wybutosine-synthesizing protein 1